jgi:hypothetical protein
MSEQPRAAAIAMLRPCDRADAFYRLMVLAIEGFPPSGDNAALDDLAVAGAAIVCRALQRMSAGKQRDELLAHLLNSLPKALAGSP